jgi:acetyl esterase/lipase
MIGVQRARELVRSKDRIMSTLISRRDALGVLAAAAVTRAHLAHAQANPSEPTTFTFKTVGPCEIKADVYGASSARARPVVVWIHGGALIMGDRHGMDARLRDLLLRSGYLFVSIDYRLGPETKLPAILDDVVDACRWVRERGPELFHADAMKLGVMGGSAGGYLTLVTGYKVEPRPKALVSFWGYGDVAAPWYSRPDEFYRRQPLVSEDEARKAVGTELITSSAGRSERGRFYLYCRQQGLWPREVAGLDPDKEPRAFDRFCPQRNVSAQYPPTLLVHGTKDTDVPYEQSVAMAKELKRNNVEHELITVEGAGHGLGGEKPETVAGIHRRVVEFLDRRLKG